MPEQTITRTQIIVVGEVGQNSYGDLTWTDKEGNNYKIPTKRRGYFNDIIVPGAAVQLNFAVYMKREYVYSATPVKDILPDKPPVTETPKVAVTPKPNTKPETPRTKDEQIERAVWIKELGECIRAGIIDKTNPRGQALLSAYYTEMCRVLGINIKEVLPSKSLVDEAKRLGAKEIRKEDN